MAPLRGWGARGERLIGKAPHGRWQTYTFLAALRSDRIEAPCLFDGPINGERFRAWVEQALVPTLPPGETSPGILIRIPVRTQGWQGGGVG